MDNTVVVRDRDEWSSLAEFIGNMVAKYAEAIDIDSLPDPDKFLAVREVEEMYHRYI